MTRTIVLVLLFRDVDCVRGGTRGIRALNRFEKGVVVAGESEVSFVVVGLTDVCR